MGPKSARAVQLARARLEQMKTTGENKAITDAKRFVFSILVNGASYKNVSDIFLWNDIKTPSKSTFYRIQPEVIGIITKMARESCDYFRSSMTPGSIIEMDGSWGHRRNSLQCILEFIDHNSKKIVDFEITEKNNHKREGDYIGSSNGMEIHCLSQMLPRWINDPNVSFFTHDDDAKTRSLIAEAGWKITEIVDTNHSMKNFPAKFENYDAKHGGVLAELYPHLTKFLRYLIYLDTSLEKKEAEWLNCANHYTGDHSLCKEHGNSFEWSRKNDANAKEVLSEFLKKTIKIIRKCNGRASTQLNESYHAIKAKIASKDLCWINSWEARACIAILQFNNPDDWKFELFDRLGLTPLSPECSQLLNDRFRIAKNKSELRHTKEYQIKEAQRRRDNKTLVAKNNSGADLYKWKSKRTYPKQYKNDDHEYEANFNIQVPSFDRDALETIEFVDDESESSFTPEIDDFFYTPDDENQLEEARYNERFEQLHFNFEEHFRHKRYIK